MDSPDLDHGKNLSSFFQVHQEMKQWCNSPNIGNMFDGNGSGIELQGTDINGKRSYTFRKRKRCIPKERFVRTRQRGILESEDEFKAIITAKDCCKQKCCSKFQSHNLHTLFQKRNTFHCLTNRADRRYFLSQIVRRNGDGNLLLLGVRVCAEYIVKSLFISRNQLYGVLKRLDNDLPISSILQKTNGITIEETICGWLLELAEAHDPQPDREYTILAHKRKAHVYEEYVCQALDKLAPMCSFSYFCHVWKKHLGSRVLVRKCMRFAQCDDCRNIQKAREETTDRRALALLRHQEKCHLHLVKQERIAYAKRIRQATNSGDDFLSLAVDGADQGAYGLPFFCQVGLIL